MVISKSKLWIIPYGLLVTIFMASWLSQTSASLPVQLTNTTYFVSGANIVNLSDPLFYDTFVPIIYEIDLPQWNISSLRIEWPGNMTSSCESSDTWGDNWTHMACPVLHHMNNVTEHFLKNMFDWKSFNSSQNAKPVRLHSCQEITSHFNSYSLGHEEWDDYFFEDLKNCPLGQHTIYEKLDLPWNEVNTTLYSTMLSRFLDETISTYKYRITGVSKYAVATNAFSAFQGIELLDFVYTSSKWSTGISTCENRKIPYTLISKSTLGSSLRKIKGAISSKDNYQLTLDADDFSNYYKLALADCAFSTKNTLLIRILVPVKKKTSQYKLSAVQPIPFLRNYGDISEICEYRRSNEKIIFEENTGVIIESDCNPGELCLIPDLANRPVTDYCLSALVQNSSEGILSRCNISCHHFETNQLPYFRRLSSDKYVVLGKSDLDIFISCDTQPFKVIAPPTAIGALEITLPCSCQLVHRRESLHSMTPCGKELMLREIMPVAWSSVGSDLTNKKAFIQYHYANDNSASVENLSLKKTQPGHSTSQKVQFVILVFFMVFLLFLNTVLIYIVFKIYKRVCKLEKVDSQRAGCNFYETPMFVRANDD